MKQCSQEMQRDRRWPRRLRLGLYWSLVLITLIAVIPAFILGVGYLSGFGSCLEPGSTSTTIICSAGGRVAFATLLIAVGLPLSRMWLGYLARTFNFVSGSPHPSKDSEGQSLPLKLKTATRRLPLGQRLLSGRIQLLDGNGRHVQCDGHVLTFWSLQPFNKGWLKDGGEAVIVYQAVPLLKSLKLALAFYTGAAIEIRAVAPVAMSVSVLIAAVCMVAFMSLHPPLSEFLIRLCELLIVIDGLYLALMIRAKTFLRDSLVGE
jgi:hypothetical protein